MLGPVGETTDECRSCGNDLRQRAQFCDVCGAAVSAVRSAVEHKQVTVLFADVVGSMKLAAVLDPERLRELMNELFNRAAAMVQRYQGTVDKFTGDGLMALFGAPVAQEDHALRACIAALEIQSVTAGFAADVARRDAVDLQLRVGLNSGEVIAGEIGSGPGRYTAVGHPVGMAQRMEAAAPAGGVLCSLSTARLVEGAAKLGPVEEVAVKGADEPAQARQLVDVESDRMVVGRNEGRMLGRELELSRLHETFQAGRGGLVGIVGGPGLGKSRLIGEFATFVEMAGAQTAVVRCDAHTTTVAFRALSRLLRALFRVDGLADAEARNSVLAQCDGLLTADAADARILFDVMGIADAAAAPLQVSIDGRRRRLVELMAHVVPVRATRTVFVVEDAHWIDAPSDDILAGFSTTLGPKSMFVMTYRPEYDGMLRRCSSKTIMLAPLTAAVTVRLASQLLGEKPSLARLADRIADAAAGNPFFAEEIVRDLADRGALSGSRGNYRADRNVLEIAVPATVQAILASRIDRLPAKTKSTLNAASVIGNRFDLDTLRALLPDDPSACLAELVSAELIDRTEYLPRQRYCFRHPLVRTVAYESQMSTTRAQAHRRLAAAIEARDPAAADENAALIATHLKAAGQTAEAYRWHMRSAEWLRPRDMQAARAQWLSARTLADRLSDDSECVMGMRIAPRTMLISTAFFVGIDADADKQYFEFRQLSLQAGDLRSFAIGTAGRIMSFAHNGTRVPEAAALASELEDVLVGMDHVSLPEIDIVLIAIAMANYACGNHDAALAASDAILSHPHEVPTIELAGAPVFRGLVEICEGNHEAGRRHLRDGLGLARRLTPVSYAIILSFWGLLVAMGMYQAEDLVDEMREALRRAESFGDICGIIAARFAYGTVLLRADSAKRNEAIDVLKRARADIEKHNLMNNTMAAIGADLAAEAADNGHRDEAIDDLRALFTRHLNGGYLVDVGCLGEALVALLIDRGDTDDLAQVHGIVDEWRVQRPGIPSSDLWWLKSRALLAEAEGDHAGYAELAAHYLKLCEKVDARGRLAEAHRMAGTEASRA
jgi:adenylate cyclase